MTPPPTVPDAARIGRTALLVTDLDEMTAFYRDVVGLAVQTRTEATATLGAGGTPLLVLTRDEEATPRDRRRAGLYHTAFRVPSRTALGAALERIRERWRLTGASDHDVSEALYLTDPEDNGVEIYADRPASEWPRTADGGVRMGTDPLDLADVAAQSDGAADAPPGTTVGHVHLEVSSVEAARRFYVETLGLGVRAETNGALFLAAGDYHHHVGVNAWNGRDRPAGGRGLAWFELLVPEDALAAVRRRFEDAGVAVEARSEGFSVSDPDSISVRIRGL